MVDGSEKLKIEGRVSVWRFLGVLTGVLPVDDMKCGNQLYVIDRNNCQNGVQSKQATWLNVLSELVVS